MEWKNKILIIGGDDDCVSRFQKILQPYQMPLHPASQANLDFSWLSGNEHLDGKVESELSIQFELDRVTTGQEAMIYLAQHRLAQQPIGLLFIDEALQGSMNSVLTIAKVWEEYPFSEIVLLISDETSWLNIMAYTGPSGRLSFLLKPGDGIRLNQLALNLAIRWSQNVHTQKSIMALEQDVKRRTARLELILEENPRLYDQPLLSVPNKSKTPLFGEQTFRILVVDDNQSIHEDFRKVLSKPKLGSLQSTLNSFEDQLFGDDGGSEPRKTIIPTYELDSAFMGKEALEMVVQAEGEGRPYALIFMDVRMPPGWDGIQTIEKIWLRFPYIEMVIVTAHADYTWEQILEKVGSTDRLSIIKKPFDSTNIKQMALTLTQKWGLGELARKQVEALEKEVEARTNQLRTVLKQM